jgi:excisionase family DNA binding protein
MQQYLTVKKAAEYLGVSRDTIYRWMRDCVDPLPHLKFGKKSNRIIQSQLDGYVERRFNTNHNESKLVEIKPA